MAIVKMRKFTLLFPEGAKDGLMQKLQRFEQVHFRTLELGEDDSLDFMERDGPAEAELSYAAEMERIRFAVDKLTPYDMRPTGLAALRAAPPTIGYDDFIAFGETFDHRAICATVKTEEEKIAGYKQEALRLRSVMEDLKPWLKLDASVEELGQLRSVDYQFGLVNRATLDDMVKSLEADFDTAYTEVIGGIKEDLILLVMAPRDLFADVSDKLKSLGFSRLTPNFEGVPERVTAECKRDLAALEQAETVARESIKALAVHCSDLRTLLDYYETEIARMRATSNFLHSRTVIWAEGWLPDDEVPAFERIVAEACGDTCYCELSDVPKEDEDVPIKLKNNMLVAPFENITEMYSLPKYGEIDPTPVLMPFYTFFFGLMVGDMAYGLIMMIATAVAIKCFNLKEGAKKFMAFFFVLGFGTVVGGVIYGSFFGRAVFTPIPVGDGTYKAILDSEADIVTMLIASVAVGVIHIIFGLLVKGYMLVKDGKPFAALMDSGIMIVTLLGGIAYILALAGMVPEPYKTVAAVALFGGMVGLALTQGRESATIAGKAGGGLYAVYGLSSYVGDFVSYTRIAALALSGAYISFSFNLMMDMFKDNLIVYIIVGGIIFLVGQALNFGLAALGAYVHTCRLMYVEFFGKFYEGGGKPFQPLKLINNFVKVEK